MGRSLILSILLFVAASITSLRAQTPTKPSPPPATLRSVLLSQLHSTHDSAEWFTPMNTAVAGLTAEQAKWVPQNAQGKRDPNANHSVACWLIISSSGTRMRWRVCTGKSPRSQ